MSRAPVIIMAGGTGGHVFPALAVAQALHERDVPVVWLGTRRGLEATVVPAAGISMQWLSIVGLRGKGLLATALFPWRLLRAVAQAWRVFGRVRPAVALGMGGFVAGPGGLAAWLRRVPLVIHEQNAIPGLTNKVLSRLARKTLEAVPGSFANGAIHTGNPIRREIAELPPPAERLAGQTGALRLLVFGGSGGAAALNEIVPDACAGVAEPAGLSVRHQCGRHGDPAEIRSRYAAAGIEAQASEFIDDMAEAYAWADLAVCRAGAITVAELAAAGVPALLVPYPYAVDDHQTANARFLTGHHAAELIPQPDLSAQSLAVRLNEYCENRGPLRTMAENARALARPQAADAVADICMEVAA